MGYRPIRVCGKTQLRQQVFNGIVDTNKQTKTPTWFCKTCGITRGSYYNMMNRYHSAPVPSLGQPTHLETGPTAMPSVEDQSDETQTRDDAMRKQHEDERYLKHMHRVSVARFAEIFGYDVLCAFSPGRNWSKFEKYSNSGLNYIPGVGILPR